MSRVPAGRRRPAGRLGDSAAEAPLRPPRPPARPLCARQCRHLGVGSAGRAATGHHEGHGRAARVRRALRAWGRADTGRREDQGSGAREVRSYRAPRGSLKCGARGEDAQDAAGEGSAGTGHREGYGRAARCRQGPRTLQSRLTSCPPDFS
ncbi:unnamed protein product [Rangifer tarandus platyrhynchus]|uniref:Uncharacterized protein n=2 Tax=Rangifer tarandus platyrhynchus TaxID=3082113 RepID=A0ABN8ZMJ8_RANTA|nr:unnamed protein product [Rangifer tarandus platyrhynchus]CAI9707112.1 unnamed protein product [Rangifer tarandus platyrhynchus]